MFGKGKKLHFRRRFDFPLLGAKSIKSAIIPRVEDGEIIIKTAFTGDFKLKLKKNDTFQREELEKVIEFLTNPEIEAEAVKKFKETGQLTDTFRICYISLKCEEIRGKLRVFALFTLEGAPLPKKKRNGEARHHYGTGEAGLDLGTQSRAVYGDNIISFENLAERNGRSTFKAEEKEAKLQRKMEASLRAMNPQNYNEDGTVKKGKKKWKHSKRYNRYRKQLRELRRKNAENRKLAIREDVNFLRSRAEVIITEPFNAEALKRKARPDPSKPNKKRRRFGRSVLHRSPGYFLSRLRQVFGQTGGAVKEVAWGYRASQYDHKAGENRKKDLSERVHQFDDGQKVQRDLYSAFLLYCHDEALKSPDRERCLEAFDGFYRQHNYLISQMLAEKKDVKNSGLSRLAEI